MADLLVRETLPTGKREGWLQKQGHLRKNWKKRWFRLIVNPALGKDTKDTSLGKLCYYVKPGGTLKGTIVIDGNTVVKEHTLDGHSFVFLVSTKAKDYLIEADSFIELSSWIEGLKDLIKGGVQERIEKRESQSIRGPTGGKLLPETEKLEAIPNTRVPSSYDGFSHSGWLVKRGHVRKNWKKRYCVLKGKTLHYFEDTPGALSKENDSWVPKGEIIIDSHCWIEDATDGVNRDFCFYMDNKIPGSKPFIFQASSEREKSEWLDILRKARDRIPQKIRSNEEKSLSLSGWLNTKGSFQKSWKHRFFVLEDYRLTIYYENPTAPKVKDKAQILHDYIIGDNFGVGNFDTSQKKSTFVITAVDSMCICQAENEEQKDVWIESLRKARMISIRTEVSSRNSRIIEHPIATQVQPTNISEEKESSDSNREGIVDEVGWLMKRGHIRKNWKRRFFVLIGHMLQYYTESPLIGVDRVNASIKPKGVFVIDQKSSVSEENEERDMCILLKRDDQELLIQPEDQYTRKLWLIALSKARRPDSELYQALATKNIIRVKSIENETFVSLKVNENTTVAEVREMVMTKIARTGILANEYKIMEVLRGKPRELNSSEKIIDVIKSWGVVPSACLAASKIVTKTIVAEDSSRKETRMIPDNTLIDTMLKSHDNVTTEDHPQLLSNELMATLADLEMISTEMDDELKSFEEKFKNQ